jgi:hypothetical protein
VRGGKRAEADVLREFLESFAGPSYVEAQARQGDEGNVDEAGFLRYYAVVSLYVAEDAAFASLLFDTWALFASRHDDGVAAGGGPGSSPQHHASTHARFAPNGFASVSEALGAGPASSRALHPRGPGQDHPPPQHYAGGHGVSGRVDLTMRPPGRGLERLW